MTHIFDKSKLPSRHVSVGPERAPHRSYYYAMGLTEEETETAEWLVRWHLVMSDTAVKRDLDDPKTVQDFVALVESPERLRLLAILTTADINAVGHVIDVEVTKAYKHSLHAIPIAGALQSLPRGGPVRTEKRRRMLPLAAG